MAKEDGQGSQLNLTVVALVALVAIVGLVALVLNTAGLAKISTGSQAVSAVGEQQDLQNAVGEPSRRVPVDEWCQNFANDCAGTGNGPFRGSRTCAHYNAYC